MTENVDGDQLPGMKFLSWRIFILFWVSVLCVFYLIFRVTITQRLRRELEAVRAAGFPITCDELDSWYEGPAPGENAADLYMRAFASFVSLEGSEEEEKLLPFEGHGRLPDFGDPMPEEQFAVARKYLEKNRVAIDLMHQASSMSCCRYPVDLSQGFSVNMNHLSGVRQGARTFTLEILCQMQAGHLTEATDAWLTSLRLGESLAKEPVLISYLTRGAVHAISLDALSRMLCLRSLPEEDLTRLMMALKETQGSEAFFTALVGERCVSVDAYRLIQSSAQGSGIFSGFPLRGLAPEKAIFILLRMTGIPDLDRLRMLGLMNDMLDAAPMPFPDRLKRNEVIRMNFQKVPRYCFLTRMFLESVSRSCEQEATHQASLRCAQASLAVEKYRLLTGALPETLQDLAPCVLAELPNDPFNGESLKYRKLERGYVVYSVGSNLVDDQGDGTYRSYPPGGPLDVVFKVLR